MTARQQRRCGTTVPRIMIDGRWANPPFALVQRLYQAAKRAVAAHGGQHDDIMARQAYLRRVSVAFHRRLRAAGIYVEGA